MFVFLCEMLAQALYRFINIADKTKDKIIIQSEESRKFEHF
jgi:hypothetical protein